MSDTGSPLPRRHLPQFRIAGLLGLMAIVSVVSSLIGAGAIAGLIWAIYLLFPSLVGVLLALFSWRDRRQPSTILTWIVGGLAGLGLIGSILSLGMGLFLWLPMVIAWMPQYALALTYFDTPTGKLLRSEEPLPENWAADLATRMEAPSEDQSAPVESAEPSATPSGDGLTV